MKIWTVIVCAALLAACDSQCDIGEEMTERASDDTIDCGFVGRGENPDEVNECVSQAFDKRDAFMARYEGQGKDSRIIRGVLGDSNGGVRFFDFDSAPCGGPSCDPVISSWTCIEPTAADPTDSSAQGRPPIDCESGASSEQICD